MSNIFFEKYNTPHNAFPFDKVRLEDYEPAMRRGMELEKEEMERLVSNAERPTFENTVEVGPRQRHHVRPQTVAEGEGGVRLVP